MKILELRFKNLNSLCGEWVINFTDPEFVCNGIFALTGPTGAGKSTILDAICLALYGATPRLGKITKSGNEIMSRQTGECYAEVVFESRAGRFRCHWEQRRAHKKADGKLQDQEHQISHAATGKPIETKKSLVGRVIEEKTGMDFDRFTRSILLAQGGFDTFLKADAEQKSKILEQITGTEIYSNISQRVHERQRAEREKLDLLQAEISGIVILEPEQVQAIQEDLEAKQHEQGKLAAQSTETDKAIKWLTTMDDLKKEIRGLAGEEVKLKERAEAFIPGRTRLERAIKAASLDGSHATLTSLRKQQSDDQTEMKKEEAALPAVKAAAKAKTEALEIAEGLLLKTRESLKTASPLIQNIRSLDQKLAQQTKAISEISDDCSKASAKIETEKQTLNKEKEKRRKCEQSLASVIQYTKEHARDEWLIGGLTGIEEQCGSLIVRQKEIIQKETDLKEAKTIIAVATKKLDAALKQSGIHRQELEGITKNLQKDKNILNEILGEKQLREYRDTKDGLLRETAYIKKIVELEYHRAKLEDGKPCPLCGSDEHPFAKGNIPSHGALEKEINALTQLIDKAEDQERVIKQREQTEAEAHHKLSAIEKVESNAANDKKMAENAMATLENDLVTLRSNFEALKLAVSEKLQPLGIKVIPESEISPLLDTLQSRLRSWQEQVSQKTTIEKQITDIDSEIKRLGAVMEAQGKTLKNEQAKGVELQSEYAAANDERKQLYGDKQPDDEERLLNKAVTDAENTEKNIRDLNTTLQQQLTSAKSTVESLKKRLEQRGPDLEKKSVTFSGALLAAGFADEPAFLEARLSLEDRNILSSQAEELAHAKTELTARQKDRQSSLAAEKKKQLTDKALEDLQLMQKELEATRNVLSDVVAALKHKLNENTASVERIKTKHSAVGLQRNEYQRWEKLHQLIGSADGKKYRNFAQGLTFELMVSHANQQLVKMTDRYQLIRDASQPLELNVMDHYQAGQIRSTKNLSGGESFIVSLTLALGLSKMASKKVRVDSLFLDEGFGTLDEEALETALETLSGLQQDGKLIGIISHVSALKERINTQIKISPVSGGRSTVSGPGCKRQIPSSG
ncbi:MAG: AAA family ATPase [Limisphaerales bacterium]